MERKDKSALIEIILFTSGDPVPLKTIKEITGFPEEEIKDLIHELINEYNLRNGGIIIKEIAEGYQFITNPAYSEWTKKIKRNVASGKLSMASLETLAIIAYKQPVTKAEIEEIRGVNSDGVIKTLLEKRLINIVGKKDVLGKPLLYGTTKEFLQYFGLKDLTELPTIKKFTKEDSL